MHILNQLAEETGLNQQDILNFADGVISLMDRDGATEVMLSATLDEQSELAAAYANLYRTEYKRQALSLFGNPDAMEDMQLRVLANLYRRAAA